MKNLFKFGISNQKIDLFKVKLSMFCEGTRFWWAIIVIYLESRGLTINQVFLALSIYNLANVVFEFPTGVIGDYFSHKASVILGLLVRALAFALFAMKMSFFGYVLVLIVAACGYSLTSGSDKALLYNVSEDFKKENANINFITTIWSVVAISIGGLLGKVDLAIPIYITSFFYILGILALLTVKSTGKVSVSSNIFSAAKDGVLFVVSQKKVFWFVFFSSLLTSLFISYKWIYNPVFEEIGFDVSIWGIMISFCTLIVAFGSLLTQKFQKNGLIGSFILLLISLFLTGFTNMWIVSLIGLAGIHITRGIIETETEVELNSLIKNSVRASVLSFKNLIMRLGSAFYLLIVGWILADNSVETLMVITALLIGIFGIFSLLKFKQSQLRVSWKS